jgi:hypothetical protein
MGKGNGVGSCNTKRQKFKTNLVPVSFWGYLIQDIWKHMNNIRHENVLKTDEHILKGIDWEILKQRSMC